ncbi:MAG: hypothetical protein IIA19_09055 [Thaumarchaeota archaeon]|nr:hypothetical protein [Nitrososphaerota archaeon]
MKQQKNSNIGIISIILIVVGILTIFATDQLLIGIGLFSLGFIIILIKIMWGISGWADDTLHRWTDQNLSPREDFDTTSEQEDSK